jgi:hypothetical protein
MGANFQTEVKIPDLRFDIYARLLPGTAFVGAAYYFFSRSPKILDVAGIVIGLFFGYFSGLVTQPLSSRVTGLLHDFVARRRGKDKLYVKRVQKELDERQAMILSKMHGETTFFVQCAVLGLILLVVRLIHPTLHASVESYVINACVSIVFLLEAVEVADRRFRRARDREKVRTEELTRCGTCRYSAVLHSCC